MNQFSSINNLSEENKRDQWEVAGITFHVNNNVSNARRYTDTSRKCLYAFGPWVGDLYLETSFWAPFVNFIAKEEINTLSFVYTHRGSDPLYNVDDISFLSREVEDSIISIYGPNVEFDENGNNYTERLFNEFINQAWDYANKNDIIDVIIVTPMNHWSGLVLGLENTYNELLKDRLKYGSLQIKSEDKNTISYNLKRDYNLDIDKDKYICIYPSDFNVFTWDPKKWNKLVNYIIDKLQLKVVLLGNKKKYEGVEGSLPLEHKSKNFIDLVTYTTMFPSTIIKLPSIISKNAILNVCSTPSMASLVSWSKGKLLMLCAETGINYESMLGVFKETTGLDNCNFVYSKNIDDIKVKEVTDTIFSSWILY